MARDTAIILEGIARTLRSIDSSLKDIAKSMRHQNGRLTFTNYPEGDPDGASTPAGSAEDASEGLGQPDS